MKHLGSPEKRAIELEESYHVITVDCEKERVANEVIEFADRFRVARKNAPPQTEFVPLPSREGVRG
jgi:alpha-beta hydrolase superfamily lysophospholipase